MTTRRFDAAVLWDPSHADTWEDKQDLETDEVSWEPALGCYRLTGGYDVLVSEAMLRSWALADANRLSGELDVPVKIIAAGDNAFLLEHQHSCTEHASEPKAFAVIEGADHTITADETMDELFTDTIARLDTYGR